MICRICNNEMEFQPADTAAGIFNDCWVCDCGHAEISERDYGDDDPEYRPQEND